MTDVRLSGRRLLIDGVPTLVTSGEIHYFRLRRSDWRQRLELLRSTGATAVATYVPWVVHERGDGTIDVTGATDPSLDVGAFLDLAADLGLGVLLRPGPFIMAEMAGEGVPDRLRWDHPRTVPKGWLGAPAPTPDLDYLAPTFLTHTRRWYQALGTVVAPRMATRGGPVFAIQLDNEIGMLAWVSNTPHLTDRACRSLHRWLRDQHGTALAARYPGLPDAEAVFAAAIRDPRPEWTEALRLDLGRYFRTEFADYADTLEDYATEAGMCGVPFLINIHGTSGGSGASFPIGISQVSQTYTGRAGRAAGSDHYLGEMNLRTSADLHMMNAFMSASSPDQPTMSLEFEAGTGDYGDDLWNDVDPTAVVLKTRLSLAQGQRLLNYYLFAGGTNFVADPPRTEGTQRFAITGERHGFAAPVDPEGRPGRTYQATAEAIRLTARLQPWLADAEEEYDELALGMILDHYLTEYRPPGSDPHAVTDLEGARGTGPRGLLGRVLLTLGYRYGAVDLQTQGTLPHLVVLGSPSAMEAAVQERLARHLLDGGALLLMGAVPTTELDGTPCTVLAEALGLRVLGEESDRPGWFTSVASTWGYGTERRVGRTQLYEAPGAEAILTEVMSGRPAGVLVERGGGAVVIGCDFGADLGFFATALEALGVSPGLRRTPVPGLITTTTVAEDGSRILHAINVSGSPVSTSFTLDDVPLFAGSELTLGPRSGVALPAPVHIGDHLLSATAEIDRVENGTVFLSAAGLAWVNGAEVAVDDQFRLLL